MKIRLKTYYLMNAIVYGLVILAALALLLLPIRTVYSKASICMIVSGFLFSGIVKAVFRISLLKNESEAPGERDVQIQNLSANRALELSDYTLIVLIFVFEYLESSDSFIASKGILLAVFGIFLPKLYKNILSMLDQPREKTE